MIVLPYLPSLRAVREGTQTAARPFVTANKVTLLRLALLPLGGWLIYQGVSGQWAALVLLTLLGCTDFVDGYLARKQGPTVLGGLMDPIADKIFVAVIFLPMTDPRIGWLDPLLVALIMMREFLVTAARTSYQRRGITLRSTYLAKIKTWEQMSAGAFFFLARVIERRSSFIAVLVACALLPLVAAGLYWLLRKRFWRGAFIFSGVFVGLTLLSLWVDQTTWSRIVLVGTVALTWYTGGSYFTNIRKLDAERPLDSIDMSRLVGALLLPAIAVALLGRGGGPAWALIGLLCAEFAMGGLDNLLVHHNRLESGAAWAARLMSEILLLTAALIATKAGAPGVAPWLVVLAVGIACGVGGIVFVRERDAYLAPRG